MKKEILHEKRTFFDMRELVEWAGSEYGSRTAYSYKGSNGNIEKISFTRLRDDVRALTSALIKAGVAGKKCVLLGAFSYEWVCVYYSVISAGGVIVPLDRDWQAEELAKTAEFAEAEFLFCDGDLSDKSAAISLSCKLMMPPVILDYEEGEFNVLISKGREIFANEPNVYMSSVTDTASAQLIVFTSGTTGAGKGVMLSQKAILSDISSVIPYIDFSDRTLGVLPPHHTFGSSVMIIGHTMIGAEVYISSGLRYVQKELLRVKPGHLILVPLYLETFYRKIQATIKSTGKEKTVKALIKFSNALLKVGIDLRGLFFKKIREAFGGKIKMIISGGAPISLEILEFFEAIGISTLNGYGITECAPIIAVNRSRRNRLGSVGPVLDVNEVIIDEPNEMGEGEILVRGNNVMLGYFKNPEATGEAIVDGYFRTGDYGRLDGDVLTITGRKKNLIILSNGKNVYPEEIEKNLSVIPGVLEVVVYEGKSKRGALHNAICAEIYPDPDFLKRENISDKRAYISGYINEYNKTAVPYQKVAEVKIREEEFPKNTLRKILRFKLDTTIE